jgi:hypothetical protein
MADDTLSGLDDNDDVEAGENDIELVDHYLDDEEYDFDDEGLEILDFRDVADAIGLPDELPALRLPQEAELAGQARSSALTGKLAALADWVGTGGRTTDDEGNLPEADAEEGARALGVDEGEFLFLWEYALTGDWIDFDEEPDFGPDEDPYEEPGEGSAHVAPGETAEAWSSGTDPGVLYAWRTTLASVLDSTLDVLLQDAPGPATPMELDGQGIAMAIMLFLARGEGLALTDISEVILDSATAELDEDAATEAKDAWLTAYGDPALLITAKLTELGAVAPAADDDGAVRLTPLGLWAVREELTDIGIAVPLLPASVTDMTAEQLLMMADDASQDEFESESGAWVAARDPEQAARELLRVAGSDRPQTRLLAVSVVARIGTAAEPALQASLGVPELRPYAKFALAGLAENAPGSVPDDVEPSPEDLAWVATDLLVLACDDEDPDPDAVAECLADSVPAGEEATLFEMMTQIAHPDAITVLEHIARHHPDVRIAQDARTAARQQVPLS